MALAAPQLANPTTTSTEDEFDPPLPFGRYHLSRRLGHGGFATVYVAIEASAAGDPREVVLKRLHEHLCHDERSREAFLDEARLAISLSHPNIVKALDFGSIDGRPFLAMEYLLGADLDRVLERLRSQAERLRLELAIQIASDLLEGLAYLHERKDPSGRPAPVVHRDVSPQNVFVTHLGVVKLLDFGIAKARARAIETTTGVIKGKFAYMSPEQANGESVEPSADIWSMGVVLWEMLAGQRLFEASSAFSTLASSMQAPIPRLDKAGEIPSKLADVVERALMRSPHERYQTGREMLVALREAAGPSTVDRGQVAQLVSGLFGDVLTRAREESVRRRIRIATPPQSKSHTGVWIFAGALVLGGAALIATRSAQETHTQTSLAQPASAPAQVPVALAPPAPVAPPAPQPAAPTPSEQTPQPHGRAASARAENKASAAASGKLTLVTIPWSNVEWNGKRLGTTPLVELSLPAGHQKLVLSNPDSGAKRTLEVTITAGQTLQKRVALDTAEGSTGAKSGVPDR